MSFQVGAITGTMELDIAPFLGAIDQSVKTAMDGAKKAQDAVEKMSSAIAQKSNEVQKRIDAMFSGLSGRTASDAAKFFEERLSKAIGESEASLRDHMRTLENLLPTVEEGSYDYRRLTEEIEKTEAELARFNQTVDRAAAQNEYLSRAIGGTEDELRYELATLQRMLPTLEEGGYDHRQLAQAAERLQIALGDIEDPALAARRAIDAEREATRQADEAARKAREGLQAKAEAMRDVGRVAAIAGAALLAASAYSLKLAADAQETANLFDVSMGSMSGSATAFVDKLNSELGIARSDIMRSVGTFDVMFTSMGLAEDKAYDLATGLTQLSYDISSFYNLPVEDAFQKLQSGISGEIEPLRRLGITVDEFTVKSYALAHGIGTAGEELTQQEKVLARYGVIMQQTGKAQGDLIRTQDSFTNQQRQAQARLKDLTETIGAGYIPAATAAFSLTNEWLKTTQTFVHEHENFTAALSSGVTTFGAVASAVGSVLYIMPGLILATEAYNLSLKRVALTTALATAGVSVLVGGIAYLVSQAGEAEREVQRLSDSFTVSKNEVESLTLAYREARDVSGRLATSQGEMEKSLESLRNKYALATQAVLDFSKAGSSADLAARDFEGTFARKERERLSQKIEELNQKIKQATMASTGTDAFGVGALIEVRKRLTAQMDQLNQTSANNRSILDSQTVATNAVQRATEALNREGRLTEQQIRAQIAAWEDHLKVLTKGSYDYNVAAEVIRKLNDELGAMAESAEKATNAAFKDLGIERTVEITAQIDKLTELRTEAEKLHDSYALVQINEELSSLNSKLLDSVSLTGSWGDALSSLTSTISMPDLSITGDAVPGFAMMVELSGAVAANVKDLNDAGIQTDEQLQAQIAHLEEQRALWADNPRIVEKLNEQIAATQKELDNATDSQKMFKDAGIETSDALTENILKLGELRDAAIAAHDPYALMQVNEQLDQMHEKLERIHMQTASLGEQISTGITAGLRDVQKEFSDVYGSVRQGTVGLARTISSSFGDGFADVAMGAKSAEEAIDDFLKTVLRRLLSTVAEIAAQWLIAQALQMLFGQTTASVAAATAEAWAPAAALASLATLGTNAIPAAAAITTTTGVAYGAAASSSIGSAAGGIGGVGHADGIESVPYTGLYKLHPAERVVPAYDASRTGGEAQSVIVNNFIVPDHVAAALAQSEAGKNVVINWVMQDAAENGPTRRLPNG